MEIYLCKVINTDNPWGVESIDGGTNFDILPEQLQEWED